MEKKESQIQDEVPKVSADFENENPVNVDLSNSSNTVVDDGSSKKLDLVKDSSNTVVDGSSKNLDLLKDSSNSVVGNSEDIADKLAGKSYEILQGLYKKACDGVEDPNIEVKERLVDLFTNKPASSVNDADDEVNKALDVIDDFLEGDNFLADATREMETDVGVGMLLAQKELGAVIKNDEKKQKTTK